RITAAIATLDSLISDKDGQALLAKIKAARSAYVASFTKVGMLTGEGKKDAAIRLMNSETLQTLDQLQEPITALAALQKDAVTANGAALQRQIESGERLLVILGAMALLTGIAASILITRTLLNQLGGEPGHAVRIAEQIASGDLTVSIRTRPGDQTSMMAAMERMRNALVQIVTQVRAGTETIATASGQIAAGNLDLSSRTEEQASALEETASSMEQLISTVKQNADNARQANQLTDAASAVALKGGAVVAQVVDTMESINASSRKIVDIIAVIDGIAFQTNILALNAAVEAARAGEQGRGFAVVASEVRNLAQRSAAAAKEIKVLITDSVDKVDTGTALVSQAGMTMQDIVGSVARVTNIMAEITAASREQAMGIEQINQAVAQMDQVTQQNAALVEEAATAAASLHDQADELVQVVSVFKTGVPGDQDRLTRRPAPSNARNPIAALP
ncbi:MAG: methyl-accepting chemotaxis protein, partial [Herminiimonas sp.]|nr:methyl-accepting chemotaxis protein [Herminiimonas sp.]